MALTSQTGIPTPAVLVEANPVFAVPWTSPQDQYSKDDPAAGLGQTRRNGYLVTLADGSVQFFVSGMDVDVLWLLFDANDGEALPADWRHWQV